MTNKLPTRVCDGCGQIWSSGRFLDPTSKANCSHCGGALVHRRRLPDSMATEFGRGSVLAPPARIETVGSTNGNGASANGASANGASPLH
jgi:hypothetical protein